MLSLIFGSKQKKKIYILIATFVLSSIIIAAIILPKNRDKNQQIESHELHELSVFYTSNKKNDEPIAPLPVNIDLDRKKVDLGERLFHDSRLSGNNKISCASCHNLNRGGTDRLVVSIGIYGKKGMINAPTVFNSGFNFKQFWDGRIDTLEDQIDVPIHSDREMGASGWWEIINKLKKVPEYKKSFNALYPDGMTSDNIKNAIATFERSLNTPNSRFDRFLQGDDKAISFAEKEGYKIFKSDGCASCHQGINVGGNMFQSLGLFGDYFQDRGNITEADLGRYNVTQDPRDRHVFKVPSLRNVAVTAPYFHDGSVKTLSDAIEIMGKYQLGRELSEKDVKAIVQFLISLTGEYQGELLK